MSRCEKCNKHDASIKLTQITPGGGEPKEYRVCPSCAEEISPYIAKLTKKPSVSAILDELIKQQSKEAGASLPAELGVATQNDTVCPCCGLAFSRYKATVMLGCPDCYEAFGELLEGDLRKIHGATRHLGAAPEEQTSLALRQQRLSAMRQELADCVENEDFERAAFLRDELKRLAAEIERESGGASS